MRKTENPEENFWSKVDMLNGPVHPVLATKCWLWTGGLYSKRWGYGAAHLEGKAYLAHRLAWFFIFREWPKNLVCHKCDVPLCCRPSHLFEGTDKDNVKDMWAKGRGRNRNNIKLTEKEVLAIKEEYAIGKTTHRKLGLKYGITKTSVGYILRGKSWRHLL